MSRAAKKINKINIDARPIRQSEQQKAKSKKQKSEKLKAARPAGKAEEELAGECLEIGGKTNIVTWSGGTTSSTLNKVLKTYLKVLNTSTRD